MTDKNSEEDAGIDEGYREPKEKVQLAGVGLGSRAAANKPTGEGLLIHCTHPALLTGVLVSLCQSVSAALNLISYGLHFPGGTKASRRDASRG